MRRLAVALVLAACAEQGGDPLPPADVAAYGRIHPVLERRCATLDCHGDMGRPLRLYAETGLRIGPDRMLPLTAEEIAANADALVGVDPTPPSLDEHLVLAKPSGGIDHVGGVIWTLDDDERTCVRGWLAGESADPSIVDACARAAAEVMLPPP